ncbi:hypothetical protein Bbelb_183350 [Branchiostoma belcheri]|nr:hypothetical protein Bbelb_183350 [Branchiostoma belcheri]
MSTPLPRLGCKVRYDKFVSRKPWGAVNRPDQPPGKSPNPVTNGPRQPGDQLRMVISSTVRAAPTFTDEKGMQTEAICGPAWQALFRTSDKPHRGLFDKHGGIFNVLKAWLS